MLKRNLSRNCSMSPAGFATALALLAAVTVAIGVVFAVLGAWLVLPFAGLEVLALAVAFRMYARRAQDERQTVGVKGEGRR